MRAAVALIILTIAACALLAAHARKPFELRIDANPGAWPTNAAADVPIMPKALICRPLLVGTPAPKPISRT